jgi:hypothetical protein
MVFIAKIHYSIMTLAQGKVQVSRLVLKRISGATTFTDNYGMRELQKA